MVLTFQVRVRKECSKVHEWE